MAVQSIQPSDWVAAWRWATTLHEARGEAHLRQGNMDAAQAEFIAAYGRAVAPHLNWPA